MKCPICGGRGCDGCERGYIMLTSCPLTMLDARTHRLMKYATYARESGLWPVAGGALDQTAAFMQAESIVRSERAVWRAHQGIPE